MTQYFSYLLWTRRGEESALKAVVDRFINDLRTMSFLTATSLGALGVCVLVLVAMGVYYERKVGEKLARAAQELEEIDRRVDAKAVVQAYIFYLLELSMQARASMDMALYMSEMRRRAKVKRPQRPLRVEARVPEFLPSLRAQRCQKDGVAVLDINDESKPDAMTMRRRFAAARLEAEKLEARQTEGQRAEIPESQLAEASSKLDTPRPRRRPIQC